MPELSFNLMRGDGAAEDTDYERSKWFRGHWPRVWITSGQDRTARRSRPFQPNRAKKMSLRSPKPIIARVVQKWQVAPGMLFALVEDLERNTWIVESCPAGTHFWTVDQASRLPRGARTGLALQEAVQRGMLIEKTRWQAPSEKSIPVRHRMSVPQAQEQATIRRARPADARRPRQMPAGERVPTGVRGTRVTA